MGVLYVDLPDATDRRGRKLYGGVRRVETNYDDRWPARGLCGAFRTPDYRPLEDVSREQRQVPYRRWPAGPS